MARPRASPVSLGTCVRAASAIIIVYYINFNCYINNYWLITGFKPVFRHQLLLSWCFQRLIQGASPSLPLPIAILIETKPVLQMAVCFLCSGTDNGARQQVNRAHEFKQKPFHCFWESTKVC